MLFPPSQQPQQSASSATEATSRGFIETVQNDRFIEFCDACRRFRYIGLCYGPPGVGKTLSARRYSRSETIVSFDRWTSQARDQLPINTIFYTTAVINTPSRIGNDIGLAREKLMGIAMNPIRLEANEVLDAIRIRDDAARREILTGKDARRAIRHRSIQPT
jgi:AAA domain